MKKVILLMMIALMPFFTLAQDDVINDMPLVDGLIKYVDVRDVPGATKDELFKRAITWVGQTFNSGKAVTQINDPSNGVFVGMGAVSENKMTVKCTFTITTKDDKYKVEITNPDELRVTIGSISPSMKVDLASNWSGLDVPYNKYVTKGKRSKNKYYNRFVEYDRIIKEHIIETLAKAMTTKDDF